MKPKKWSLVELKRFDRVLLQISLFDYDRGEYSVVGTITLEEDDTESREEWLKAIEDMNQENSRKSL